MEGRGRWTEGVIKQVHEQLITARCQGQSSFINRDPREHRRRVPILTGEDQEGFKEGVTSELGTEE